jgi:glycopeptide antibiotics resistance protein
VTDGSGKRRYIALICSVLFIAVVTLTPRTEYVSPRWDMGLTSNPRELLETLLNVALFLPFGVSLRWLRVNPYWAIALGFALSLGVEVLQRTVIPGREAELQDLIANTLGALLGWLIARMWQRQHAA